MKKVLIISYHFPPRPTVGGLRPLGLAKYLPEFGWDVTILTAKLPDSPSSKFSVVETSYEDRMNFVKKLLGINSEQSLMTQMAQLKKKLHIKSEKSILDLLLKVVGEITAYPDAQKNWKNAAIKAGNELLESEHFDAIISTSSPVTSHIIAKALKEKHKLPWIADLRDLWTQNHYYPYSRLRKRFEENLELNTLHDIDALVTVSKPAFSKLAILHKNKPIFSITNGFDPVEVNDSPIKLTNKFTITYTGNFYPGKQSIEPLLKALKNMEIDDIEVRLYGAELGWIDEQIKQYELERVVKQYGIVPRDIVLNKQRESQILLLIKWDDPDEKGTYTAKLFEYLAAKRPILVIGGFPDVVDEVLEETGVGYKIDTIEKLYLEYKTTGAVAYNGGDISKYSQRDMAGKFATILDNIYRRAKKEEHS